MSYLLQPLEADPALFIFTVALLGLLVGSFLNVVIYRLPRMMEADWRRQCAELTGSDSAGQAEASPFNLITPRSACPHCQHRITALENIPLISYLFLHGRCRTCGAPISLRYPLVELLTAVVSATVAWHFGFGWQALGALLLSWSLIALSFIDTDTQLLPDDISLPMLWLGLGFNLFGTYTSLADAVLGAMAGYLSLWLVFMLFKLVTGKEGMGYGDFKLLAMLGAWLGWQSLPLIIMLSSVVGATFGIAMLLLARLGRSQPIPFGPYIACAGWIALLWGDPITQAYLHWAFPR